MNQNDKRNDQNNKGGKNLQGVLRLVAWALLLTLVLVMPQMTTTAVVETTEAEDARLWMMRPYGDST